MSARQTREPRSHQINRAFYARGRPQNRLPQTINETEIDINFTEINTARQNEQNPQFQPRPLQRRFHSEIDVRTNREANSQPYHVTIDIDDMADFDDSTDDHVHALTAGMGSNWTIADP